VAPERFSTFVSRFSHLRARRWDVSRFRSRAPVLSLDDPAVPVGLLLGPDAVDVVEEALAPSGIALRTLTPRQTNYHPGRSLTVRYDATLTGPDGLTTNDAVVAAARAGTIEVWRVPHDPALPGLAAALDTARVQRLLHDLGAPAAGVRCRLRAYRPGRRAVVAVEADHVRLFVKIVRPDRVEALHRRHVLLADHVPVPRSLGWSDELGIVVLQALGGTTLRAALADGRPAPSASALVALLDALPAPMLPGARRPWDTPRHAAVVGACIPDLQPQLAGLVAAADDVERVVAREPCVPVHGDFHEAQLLVDGARVTGLLDVDTFGTGARIDDLATIVGHLSTLATMHRRRATIERYAAQLLAVFDRLVDAAHLRVATAAVIVGLATGPFRVLEADWPAATRRRVDLARRWLASAGKVRHVSSPRHAGITPA